MSAKYMLSKCLFSIYL